MYFVSWCIVSMVSAPCPDKIKTDEFGRQSSSYTTCAVLHLREERDCEHRTDLMSRDSAIAFMARASKASNGYSIWQSKIDNIQLDSTPVLTGKN